MNTTDKDINQLLIVSITPYFLDKGFLWFQENLHEILSARHSQNFFEDNIIFLEKDHSFQFSQFLRKLDEMGYERVFKVSEPGEFSQRGGIIDIFPINLANAVRLDFLGNDNLDHKSNLVRTLHPNYRHITDRKVGTNPYQKSLEILA